MRARLGATPTGHRLTRIEESQGDINIEALIQVEDVAVTISHQGYAKRVALATYRQQGRGGKGIIAGTAKDEDFIEHMFVASTHDDLLCFTDLGRVFKIKVYELPDLPRQSKGRAMVNLIDLRRIDGAAPAPSAPSTPTAPDAPEAEGGAGNIPRPGRTENVRAFLNVKNFEEGSNFLTFVSREGIVKRTPLKDYRNVNKSGLIAVGLKEGDELLDVTLTTGSDDLLLATAGGMAIRFNEQDVRLMGRGAAGVKGIELGEHNEVIGVVRIPMAHDADGDLMTAKEAQGLSLLTVTEKGFGKRTPVDEYRVQPETGKIRSQSRGGKGRADINTSERNGRAVAALGVHEGDDVVVISRAGMLVRMAANTIRSCGRGAQGVRVVSLDEGDVVVAAARVSEENGERAGE
jgi:DNA gyrase subunit A